MQSVRMLERVRAELVAHAREHAPQECCGMVVGENGRIEESIRMRNIAPDPTRRYLIDPAEHIALNRRLRGTARSIVGAYHSHPQTSPVPSETDRVESAYCDFVWVIVSLAGVSAEVAAFRLADGRVVQLPLLMEP